MTKTITLPKISIGMPVYNGEPFIQEALDSILAQTFTDFELIISDNASSDETETICRAYAAKDSRIRYVRQKDNLGPIANFKFVLEESITEYFMWAAADDKCTPVFLEELYRRMLEDEELLLVMSDVSNIFADGSFLRSRKLENIRIESVKCKWPNVRPLFFENPTSNIFFCIYGLFKARKLKQIELNYRNRVKFSTGSEIPLLAQLAILGKIGSIPGNYKIYRTQSASIYCEEQKSFSFYKHVSNKLNISLVLFSILLESKLPLSEKLRLSRSTVFSFSKWAIRYPAGRIARKLVPALRFWCSKAHVV